jgi:alkylation response protein AidB-like acyl-CoA dehydrogenase
MTDATTIRQIELQLHKAEHGFGMPYDGERVAQLRGMLHEARKQKLARALAAKRPPLDFFRHLAVNYRQLAKIAGNPDSKQRLLDMAAEYQAKAEESKDDEQ